MNNTLVMALHAHQPVGNFEEVFRTITDESYRPFLESFRSHEAGSISYHASGILLRWWQNNHTDMIDLIGDLVDVGRLELLTGGFYEPILPLIPESDRLRQIELHREYLHTLFGVDTRGLWLTERVWYPDLPSDLARAGVEYLAVDDNHFRAAGWNPDDLHGHYHTEYEGDRIGIFPIKKQLRYAIPFHDVPEVLETVDEQPGRVLTMADDAEKFGSWPDTSDWVYRDGWLDRFLDAAGTDRLTLTSMGDAYDRFPSRGPVYLPTASYEEMEEWALPEDRRRTYLRQRESSQEEDDSFLRGGHFHNFLVKYPESNRLHKRMLLVSRRHKNNRSDEPPPDGLLAAQCNDAYWHGVFGGLYLPHLRGALWQHLGTAHEALVEDEPRIDREDYDRDGVDEILVEGPNRFLAIDPAGTGELVDWHHFPSNSNLLNILSRRWPSYLAEETTEEDDAAVDTIHHQRTEVPEDWLTEWSTDPVPRAGFQPVSVEPDAGPVAIQTNEALRWIRDPDPPRSIRVQGSSVRLHYHGTVDAISYDLSDHGGTWMAQGFRPDNRPGVLLTLGVVSPKKRWSGLESGSERWRTDVPNRIDADRLALVDRLGGWKLNLTMVNGHHWITHPVESISRSEREAEKIFQGIAIVMVADGDDLGVEWTLEENHA